MRRLQHLTDSELNQLGLFMGLDINRLASKSMDKKAVLENYIIYTQLQDKVKLWFRQRRPIAISYSYSVKECANIINDYLLSRGYNPMIDNLNIDCTDRCITSFENLLSEQPLFLAILNNKYMDSLNCMRELYLFCSKYDFDTSKVCQHLVALWDSNLNLSSENINTIANNWSNKIYHQNKLIESHEFSVRNKLVMELDWYAKIYHRCIDMLFILKDVSAIIIDDNFEITLSKIEQIINKKLNLL